MLMFLAAAVGGVAGGARSRPSRWGTAAVLLLAPGHPTAGEASTAGTPAFTTFVFYQIFNLPDGLADRAETASIAPAWATARRAARR